MRDRHHFIWLEMSSGDSGAGGGAAGGGGGGGGGGGALVTYDGGFAAVASAGTVTPGLRSDGAPRMRADSASSSRGADCGLLDATINTGSGWDRDLSESSAVSVKGDGGSDIDYRLKRSQAGGGRTAFMDAACRRAAYAGDSLRPGSTGNRRSGGEPVSPEGRPVRDGSGSERVDKRRAHSFCRASKRACVEGEKGSSHCGISGSKGGESRWTRASLRLTPGDSAEPVRPQRPAHAWDGLGEGPHLASCAPSGSPSRRSSRYRPAATGGVFADDSRRMNGRPPGTGRVRVYGMRSFAPAAGATGVSRCAPGGAQHALSGGRDPAEEPQPQPAAGHHADVRCRRSVGAVGSGRPVNGAAQEGIPPPRERALFADEAASLHYGDCTRAGWAAPTEPSGCERTARCRALLEAGTWDARRRLARLEERTDNLQRRLRVVQVKQVEKHVAQQLQGLLGAAGRRAEWGWTGSSAELSGELSRLAQSCSQALRTAESGLDSDHTASSSGGESEVEERGEHWLPRSKVQDSPEWWWVQERAWLGSRWAWLQAQVSELEYRIRGLSDLYTQLRRAKGGGIHHPTDCLLPVETPQVKVQPPSTGSASRSTAAAPLNPPTEEPAASSLTSAARVRALRSQHRSRLVFPGNAIALSAKAVSVPCSCMPPLVCILCTGSPPIVPFVKDVPPQVRAAQLDLSLHSILSLPPDVHLGLQCAALLRVLTDSHGAVRPISRQPLSSRLAGQGKGSHRLCRPKRRAVCPQPRPLLHSADTASDRAVRGLAWSSHRTAPAYVSPLPPLASDTPSQPARRRRGETSFDIDNLVMPLGSGGRRGGARVQRLEYKEILTPSWRELGSQVLPCATKMGREPVPHDVAPGPASVKDREREGGDVEDMSDAAFQRRHAPWEFREKGRWGRGAHRSRRGRSLCRRGGKVAPTMESSLSLFAGWESQCVMTPRVSGKTAVLEEGELVVLPWKRRMFPLSAAELRWLLEEEEDEEELATGPLEALITTSARSRSTDSGISVGSQEFSPGPPWPPGHFTPPPTQGTPPPYTQGSWRGR